MEKRFNIVNNDVEKYIQDTLAPLRDNLQVMYVNALKNGVPVARLEVLRVLETYLILKKPYSLLELGTATGFTSIFFSEYLKDNGYIDTVENDLEMVKRARENIKEMAPDKNINVIYAEACDYLKNIHKKYDIIFIDAAKGHYEEYFDICSNLVNENGIIFSDNVLYRGMVAKGDKIPHRQKTLVERLHGYLNGITKDERFCTSILSVGDGLSVSVKK